MARRRSKKYIIPQLSTEEYEKQLAEQGGHCACCDRVPKGRRLNGDHSHKTGQRRGLLCFPCNYYVINAIDKFNVDPERVAEYYRKYGK
jgi:hypothetical protein